MDGVRDNGGEYVRAVNVLLSGNCAIFIQIKHFLLDALDLFRKHNGHHDGQYKPPGAQQDDDEDDSQNFSHNPVSL